MGQNNLLIFLNQTIKTIYLFIHFFFITSSRCQKSSFSRNCVGGPPESLHPLSSNMISIRGNPEGNTWLLGGRSSQQFESPSREQLLPSQSPRHSAHKQVPGCPRLSHLYTVRRRRSSVNHKTNGHLRTASCFLHTRHRNPANKRATSTTNKRTTIFNISAWQRDRNRRCLQRQ